MLNTTHDFSNYSDGVLDTPLSVALFHMSLKILADANANEGREQMVWDYVNYIEDTTESPETDEAADILAESFRHKISLLAEGKEYFFIDKDNGGVDTSFNL